MDVRRGVGHRRGAHREGVATVVGRSQRSHSAIVAGRGSTIADLLLAVQDEGVELDVSAGHLDLDGALEGHSAHRDGVASEGQGLRIAEEPVAIGHGLGHAVVGATRRQGRHVDLHDLLVTAVRIRSRRGRVHMGPRGIRAGSEEIARARRQGGRRLLLAVDGKRIEFDVSIGELNLDATLEGYATHRDRVHAQ